MVGHQFHHRITANNILYSYYYLSSNPSMLKMTELSTLGSGQNCEPKRQNGNCPSREFIFTPLWFEIQILNSNKYLLSSIHLPFRIIPVACIFLLLACIQNYSYCCIQNYSYCLYLLMSYFIPIQNYSHYLHPLLDCIYSKFRIFLGLSSIEL